ncbi:MAG: hypothetical protein B7Z19_02290 [Polynucleobacter sp. 32-46-5]|nr:MAG: hypothetical protein B7Z19_02290 [Polynucleobacter sp. 32-46-5]
MADDKEPPLFHALTNHQAISCLCFVGGFIDAAGYIMLYGLFTSSITGNIITAVVPLYADSPGVLPRFWIWVFIWLGAFTNTMISMKLRFATLYDKWVVGIVLFGMEVIGLFFAVIVGACLHYPRLSSWQVTVTASFTAFAMGLQNGAAMVMIPNCPPTTAMTGNTVRFGIYGAEAFNFYIASRGYVALYPAKAGKPKHYEKTMAKFSAELATKFQLFCSCLGPFFAGALMGVPCANWLDFWSFSIPMLVIIYVLWNMYKARQLARAANPELYDGSIIEEHVTTESPMAGLHAAESSGVDDAHKHAGHSGHSGRSRSSTRDSRDGHKLKPRSRANTRTVYMPDDYLDIEAEEVEDDYEEDDVSVDDSKYALFVDDQSGAGELRNSTVRRSSISEMNYEGYVE